MAKTKKKCRRGFECGFSCISRTRICRSNIGEEGKLIVESFTNYLVRIGRSDDPESLEKLKRLDKFTKTIQQVKNNNEGFRVGNSGNRISFEEINSLVTKALPEDSNLLQRLEIVEKFSSMSPTERQAEIDRLNGTINTTQQIINKEEENNNLNNRLKDIDPSSIRVDTVSKIMLDRDNNYNTNTVLSIADAIAKVDNKNLQSTIYRDEIIAEAKIASRLDKGIFNQTDERSQKIQKELRKTIEKDNERFKVEPLGKEGNSRVNTQVEEAIRNTIGGVTNRTRRGQFGSAQEVKKIIKDSILKGGIILPDNLAFGLPEFTNSQKAQVRAILTKLPDTISIGENDIDKTELTRQYNELFKLGV